VALDYGNHILKGQLITVIKDGNGNKVVRTVGPVDKDGNVIQKKREVTVIRPKKKKETDEDKIDIRIKFTKPVRD